MGWIVEVRDGRATSLRWFLDQREAWSRCWASE